MFDNVTGRSASTAMREISRELSKREVSDFLMAEMVASRQRERKTGVGPNETSFNGEIKSEDPTRVRVIALIRRPGCNTW